MVDPERLIAQIEEAFAGVTLEYGLSLNECEYADSGGRAKEYLERAKQDERGDWHKVINDDLTNYHVTFSFTDLKGFRFYLPAYMIWTIRNPGTTDIIADFTIYACDPDHHRFEDTPFTTFFNAKQLEAIIAFLTFCIETCEEEDCPLDADVARLNLRKIEARLGGSIDHGRSK